MLMIMMLSLENDRPTEEYITSQKRTHHNKLLAAANVENMIIARNYVKTMFCKNGNHETDLLTETTYRMLLRKKIDGLRVVLVKHDVMF